MIVRDARATVRRAVLSALELADRAVIMDTGSVDGTTAELVALEDELGGRLRWWSAPWRDSFSQARNVTLEIAEQGWALIVDADEELILRAEPAALRDAIRAGPAFPLEAYTVPVASVGRDGRQLAGDDAARSARIHPVRGVRYRFRAHNLLSGPDGEPLGTLHALPGIGIAHGGYADGETLTAKARRTLALLDRDLVESGPLGVVCFHRARALLQLGRVDDARASVEGALRAAPSESALMRGLYEARARALADRL